MERGENTFDEHLKVWMIIERMARRRSYKRMRRSKWCGSFEWVVRPMSPDE